MRARVWTIIAGVCACGAGSCTPQPTAEKPSSATPAKPLEAAATKAPVRGSGQCEAVTKEYRVARDALNQCKRDNDCAESWPGLCPEGPFYIERDSNLAQLRALGTKVAAACGEPDCEQPPRLGIAHCEANRCQPGRADPPKSDAEDCWDYRETHLEPKAWTSAETATAIQGITPHLVISPAQAGTLRMTIDWPEACADCKLLVSEHNSGMARLVESTVTSTETIKRGAETIRREHLEFAVTPGPYHLIGKAAAVVDYRLETDLQPPSVTRHGTAWARLCEG